MKGKMPNAGNKLVIETEPWTKGDAIRDMTDEELAHFLEMKAGRFVSFYPTQAKSWLDWLREEAKDGEQS